MPGRPLWNFYCKEGEYHDEHTATDSGALGCDPRSFACIFSDEILLKQTPGKLAVKLLPLMLVLCMGGGLLCWHFRISTAPLLAFTTLTAGILYIRTLRISLWKSGTIVLSVCAVLPA